MKQKKKNIFVGVCVCALTLSAFVYRSTNIEAYDFEGNETYWTNYCSGYISDANKRDACYAYSAYIQNKIADSNENISNLTNNIASVKSDLSNLKEVSQQYSESIASVENEISAINTSLTTMQSSIDEIEVEMNKTNDKISKRTETIKERMVQLQVTANTNQYLDFIMGATDLVDLIQKSSSINTFTKNDKKQIKSLNKEIKQLKTEKEEKQRIEETLLLQQENLNAKENELQSLKTANDAMVEEYEVKVAELEAKKNEANAASNTLAALSPSFSISGGSADVGNINSNGWFTPIQNSYISRGVSYGHRGVDFAASKGTPIYAPADCYVVFASTGYGDGYLGCWEGVPSGGGNSVRIIFSINGQTFAMNFHHLQASSAASLNNNGNGVVVKQGTVLGWVGSSGNSSGPHAHVELFTLNQNIQQAVATWYSTGDWQSSAGWGMSTPASGSYGTRVDPLAYIG